MLTTVLDHHRAEHAPGDLGKALALLIQWGREENETAEPGQLTGRPDPAAGAEPTITADPRR